MGIAANGAAAASSGSKGPIPDVVDPAAFAQITGGSGLTVVDYWAPWCRNCKKISPTIDRLAAETGATFIKVNTVEAEAIAADNGVDALPTFQFFKGGKKIGEFKGSDASAIEAAIKSYL